MPTSTRYDEIVVLNTPMMPHSRGRRGGRRG